METSPVPDGRALKKVCGRTLRNILLGESRSKAAVREDQSMESFPNPPELSLPEAPLSEEPHPGLLAMDPIDEENKGVHVQDFLNGVEEDHSDSETNKPRTKLVTGPAPFIHPEKGQMQPRQDSSLLPLLEIHHDDDLTGVSKARIRSNTEAQLSMPREPTPTVELEPFLREYDTNLLSILGGISKTKSEYSLTLTPTGSVVLSQITDYSPRIGESRSQIPDHDVEEYENWMSTGFSSAIYHLAKKIGPSQDFDEWYNYLDLYYKVCFLSPENTYLCMPIRMLTHNLF
jgi:hypothetical protein